MNSLELTVTAQQVKGFLDTEFEHFLDDSYGMQNYGRHVLGLPERMRWWQVLPLPQDIRQYFNEVRKKIGSFEWSIQAITYPAYSQDRQKELQDHYDSLVRLASLYSQGLVIEASHPDNKELKVVMQGLRRQILVANTLYDPKKRDYRFRHLMYGNPTKLDAFLDKINQE